MAPEVYEDMAAKSKKKQTPPKKRIRHLEAELLTLQAGHPTYTSDKKRLESEIQLAKAEMKMRNKRAGRSAVRREVTAKSVPSKETGQTAKKKRVPLPGGASFPSFKLPNPKSPTFYDDSVKTMSNLRQFCKQAAGYVQRADKVFDSLHGVGSHLHQAGVLPKLTQGKFKDLTMGDWTALLMALMNSPLSGLLLGGAQEGDKKEDKTEAKAEAKAEEDAKETKTESKKK